MSIRALWLRWRSPVPLTTYALLRVFVGVVGLYQLYLFGFYLDWLDATGPARPDVLEKIYSAEMGRLDLFFSFPAAPLFVLGIFSALCFTLGLFTRLSGFLLWLILVSIRNRTAWAWMDGGVQVLPATLLILLFAPGGAMWSLDRRWRVSAQGVEADSWPVRLIQLQLCLVYLQSGYYKLLGSQWFFGKAVAVVLSNPNVTRFDVSGLAQLPAVGFSCQLLTWVTWIWELTFPLAMLWFPARRLWLLIGIGFHLGLALFLQLGIFPAIMLLLYVTFLPRLPGRVLAWAGEGGPGKTVYLGRAGQSLAWVAVVGLLLIAWPDKSLLSVTSEGATPIPLLFRFDQMCVASGQILNRLPGMEAFRRVTRCLALDHKFTTFAPVVATFTTNYVVVECMKGRDLGLIWNGLPDLDTGHYSGYPWPTRLVGSLAMGDSPAKVYLLLESLFRKAQPAPGHWLELREFWAPFPFHGRYAEALRPGRSWRYGYDRSGSEYFSVQAQSQHSLP